jgi:hypothetical protein
MRYLARVAACCLLATACGGIAVASPTRYRWRKPSIAVAISSSVTSNLSNIATGADVNGAIDRSIGSWEKASAVSLRRFSSLEQSVSAAGPQGDGISLVTIAATPENVALFPLGLDDATARTRVFYDARGFITEADIVLNPYLQFSTDGTTGTFDLESTLTHEFGHLLGLSHSPVVSATMNDDYGRNGTYNLPAFAARTLAADDIASIRSVYGPAIKDENCCGRISGRLLIVNRRSAVNYTVWAQEADGRVAAATTTGSDGSFKLGGLPNVQMRLFAQSSDADPTLSFTDLGAINLSLKPSISIQRKIDGSDTTLHADFLGFNGQLAAVAIPVNSGNVYSVAIGSSDISQGGFDVETESDDLVVQSESATSSYGNGLSMLGFNVAIKSTVTGGEYSLVLRNSTGERRAIIGALTVEKFPNLWVAAAYK